MNAWSQLPYLVGLSMIDNIGSIRLRALIEHYGQPERVWRASAESIRQVRGFGDKLARHVVESRKRIDPVNALEQIRRDGIRVVSFWDKCYPVLLRFINDPPLVLYVRGQLHAADYLCPVAIVGTRNCSPTGKEITYRLARQLAGEGVTVISGLARGIDAAAHNGALSAGGRTIAVLGSGVDRVYPPVNRRLAAQICRRGALISEYTPRAEPEAGNFPARNRIISGMSLAVVVAEAGERSGALITADMALEQNREVMAVPGSINKAMSRGSNRLIQTGATLVLDASDVVENLPGGLITLVREELEKTEWETSAGSMVASPVRKETDQQESGAGPGQYRHESRITKLLANGPMNVEELVEQLSWPLPRILNELTRLELSGQVQRLEGDKYCCTAR